MLGHIAWVREQLQLGLITKVAWCDTRDMTADGHTKGSVSRELLLRLMQGQQRFHHEVKIYEPYRKKELADDLQGSPKVKEGKPRKKVKL